MAGESSSIDPGEEDGWVRAVGSGTFGSTLFALAVHVLSTRGKTAS